MIRYSNSTFLWRGPYVSRNLVTTPECPTFVVGTLSATFRQFASGLQTDRIGSVNTRVMDTRKAPFEWRDFGQVLVQTSDKLLTPSLQLPLR